MTETKSTARELKLVSVMISLYICCRCCRGLCAVELSCAGDGTVEITITDPSGQLIPHQIIAVEPSLLEVHYTPITTGIHCAVVTYNGVPVPGSFQMELMSCIRSGTSVV